MDEARKLKDESISDDIIYKITHCRSLIGIKNNNFRLKRSRMAGASLESIIDYINQFDLFRELTHEYISYEGRKSLGLIIHMSDKPIYITKIIKTEEEFFRESQFYEKLRKLGGLETVTPSLIFKAKFSNVFLITLEYIDVKEEHIITPEKVLTALNILGRVNTRSFPDLSKNNQLAVPSETFNYRRIIREFYKILYMFSENPMINYIHHILSIQKLYKISTFIVKLILVQYLASKLHSLRYKFFITDLLFDLIKFPLESRLKQ